MLTGKFKKGFDDSLPNVCIHPKKLLSHFALNNVSYHTEAPGEMLMWCQSPLLIKFLFYQAPIP